jgi:hypothetical protein
VILQFKFFLNNDFALLFCLFWLFLAAITGFVYLMTAFVRKPQTAVYTGFIVFLVGGVGWRGSAGDGRAGAGLARGAPPERSPAPGAQPPSAALTNAPTHPARPRPPKTPNQAGWTFQGIVTYGLPYTPSFYYESNSQKRIYHRAIFWLFTVMPWNPLAKAILDMAAATNTNVHPGLRWAERDSYCVALPQGRAPPAYDPLTTWKDLACIFPVGSCLAALATQFFVYTALAVWLDAIMPNELGVRRHPFFFLHRAFWKPRHVDQGAALARLVAEGEARLAAQKEAAKTGRPVPRVSVAGGADEDEDVGEEAGRIKRSLGQKVSGLVQNIHESEWLGLGRARRASRASGGAGAAAAGATAAVAGGKRRSSSSDPVAAQQRQWANKDVAAVPGAPAKDGPAYAVEVFGLQKVFRVGWWTSHMPRWLGGTPGSKDFWAIKDSWFGIEEGRLFCLLGPNGAGKTTTINCLTGARRGGPGSLSAEASRPQPAPPSSRAPPPSGRRLTPPTAVAPPASAPAPRRHAPHRRRRARLWPVPLRRGRPRPRAAAHGRVPAVRCPVGRAQRPRAPHDLRPHQGPALQRGAARGGGPAPDASGRPPLPAAPPAWPAAPHCLHRPTRPPTLAFLPARPPSPAPDPRSATTPRSCWRR